MWQAGKILSCNGLACTAFSCQVIASHLDLQRITLMARWTGRALFKERGWTWTTTSTAPWILIFSPTHLNCEARIHISSRRIDRPVSPEHFSRCKVIYKDIEYEGWVCYPHPETKLCQFSKALLFWGGIFTEYHSSCQLLFLSQALSAWSCTASQ